MGRNRRKFETEFKTSVDRRDRSRSHQDRSGRSGSSDLQKRHRAMAFALSKQYGQSSIEPPSVSWKPRTINSRPGLAIGDTDRTFKKMRSLGSACEKRRYTHHLRQELGSISQVCQVPVFPRARSTTSPISSIESILMTRMKSCGSRSRGFTRNFRATSTVVPSCRQRINRRRVKSTANAFDLG